MKAILTTKVTSNYDDRPEEFYHFPSTYLQQVQRAVGDYIIYYEPRRMSLADSSRGGRQSYFATAKIEKVIPDHSKPDHYYALISGYLDFDSPVPYEEGGEYYESALRKKDGTTNRGAFGRAVRNIPEVEFDQILKAGFATELHPLDGNQDMTGMEEPVREFERPLVELTVTRPFRDQAFKRSVRAAYDNRCAVTGLRLINGGGRPEVQAAHIMPVASKGPDSIRNGLALSGTVHWMFDRGLISVDDNYRILVAKKGVPDPVLNLLNRDGRLILPQDDRAVPHPFYLKHHRDNVFKG